MRTSAVIFAVLSGFVSFSTAAPVAKAALGDDVMGSIFGSAVGNPGSANEDNAVGNPGSGNKDNVLGSILKSPFGNPGSGNKDNVLGSILGSSVGNPGSGNKDNLNGSPIGSGNSAGNGNGNGNGSGNKASADGNTLNGISIGSVGDILPDIVLPQEINVSPSISL